MPQASWKEKQDEEEVMVFLKLYTAAQQPRLTG